MSKHVRWRIHIVINSTRTSKHLITYCISPVLDGTVAVGMEVTTTEGARDDTGIAVDNVKTC